MSGKQNTVLQGNAAQRGFTLIELIMVIVIMGVIGGMVSVFMKSPIDAYFDSARRAALTDVADTAVRRISRDIRKALPMSIRQSIAPAAANNQCVEFIATKTGGRYRAADDGAGGGDFLDFLDADSSFNMLGSNLALPADQRIAQNDVIVIYNQGLPDSDAYTATNTAIVGAPPYTEAVLAPATGIETRIPLTIATLFPLESGGKRFHVVPSAEQIVSYVCSGVQLRRTVRNLQPATAACPATGAVLANNVSACNFVYNPDDIHNALVQLSFTFTDSGESVNLYHEVHVDNTP